jgi:hypothetical protein
MTDQQQPPFGAYPTPPPPTGAGSEPPSPEPPEPAARKPNWFTRHPVITGISIVVISLIVIAGVAGGGGDGETSTADETTTTAEATTEATEPAPTTTEAPTTTVPPTATTTAPPEDPELTNARQAAQDYLDFGGFSRQGLIDQLSSEYGDQYPVEIATAAVDSLTVDWNAEAVEAADSYLEFQSFSHAGLVDQLSSEYGDQFTREQAEHGATVALGA